MRVLQLIDSLDAGGAERMAVTYANELVKYIDASFLCVTRREGILKETLSPSVGYLYLNRTATFDRKALRLLHRYIIDNSIDILHAHTTSYFIAALLKLRNPKIKIIWHEHQGNRIHQNRLKNKALYFSSFFFNTIFTVNEELSNWCKKNLFTKRIYYIPNFVSITEAITSFNLRRKEIICVANLKKPKNHMNLLKAFKIVSDEHENWKLLLVGRLKNDDYSNDLKYFISSKNMESNVQLLGEQLNVLERMNMASIGVISSDDEGLPMALLEYGISGLAVVSTGVGHCAEVIQDYGQVVPPDDSVSLAKAILTYIEAPDKRKTDASNFSNHIKKQYSIESIIPKILSLYKEVYD